MADNHLAATMQTLAAARVKAQKLEAAKPKKDSYLTKRLLVVIGVREAKQKSILHQFFRKVSAIEVRHNAYQNSLYQLNLDIRKEHSTHVGITLQCFQLFKQIAVDCGVILHSVAGKNTGTKLKWKGVEVILLPNLLDVHTINEGQFLLTHYIDKLLGNLDLLTVPVMRWTYINTSRIDLDKLLKACNSSPLLAVDIETEKEHLAITSISFSTLTHSYVLNFVDDNYAYYMDIARQILKLPVPKVFQNGMYDCLYLIRFNMEPVNYIFDTEYLSHQMFQELPKDIGTLALMYLDNGVNWKEEKATNELEYNAKDTWYTLWCFLGQLKYAKQHTPWYFNNYLLKFPEVFPCLTCSLEGFAVDLDARKNLRDKSQTLLDDTLSNLRYLIGIPEFNPNSPKQVLALLKAFGINAATTKEQYLTELMVQHPIYTRVLKAILTVRGERKAIGTYYDSTLLDGRYLYNLDPFTTPTGRLASTSSGFWCGGNVQNQPSYARPQYQTDPGYVLVEIDNEQSESRTTAYITRDEGYRIAVEESPDFHSYNASQFFGVPFEEIYDAKDKKVLMKPLRDLSKRVNHGVNYNMQAIMLLQTMGTQKVVEARNLLGLPQSWSLAKVCQHLLNIFDSKYPRIRGENFKEVIKEVMHTKCLTLPVPNGWTRRTFLNPTKSKEHLNRVVAHKPQSLSVFMVNEGFFNLWLYQMQTNSQIFRLKAQVHDSVMFQIKEELQDQYLPIIDSKLEVVAEVHGKPLRIPRSTTICGTHWNK